jgi:senataxin
MHPDISQLPSRIFYQGRLKDAPNMAEKTKQPWHSHAKFGTYRFFNVSRGQEEQAPGHSLKNPAESKVAASLFARLQKEFSSLKSDFKVGVVAMYSGQVSELRRTFQQRFGSDIFDTVDFHTVDGFQGQEKDVIILSCVRAGPGLQSVGFLSGKHERELLFHCALYNYPLDTRRINVAVTRAKSSLFILGNAATLERSDETWRNIVQDSRARSSLIDVRVFFDLTKVELTRRRWMRLISP